MDQCLYCTSKHIVKNGKLTSGGQRYRCGECDKQFSEGGSRPSYCPSYRDQVTEKYCHEGWKVKDIIKQFGISTRTLIKRKKQHEEGCQECHN